MDESQPTCFRVSCLRVYVFHVSSRAVFLSVFSVRALVLSPSLPPSLRVCVCVHLLGGCARVDAVVARGTEVSCCVACTKVVDWLLIFESTSGE